MICEAEKRAAVSVDSNDTHDSEYAKTVVANYSAVSKVVSIDVPLRRPSRRQPSHEAERELYLRAAAEREKYIDSLAPKGAELKALAKAFPAPDDWYKED
jgi:hypothetical protein